LAQIKKAEVRQAILDSAFRNFAERGYARTSLARIARDAGISTSNIYVYFASKLEILQAIFGPWLLDRMDALEAELQAIAPPRQRLRRIFEVLWDEIPAADGAFALNLMQGLTLVGPKDRYSRDLLHRLEARVTAMIARCLPEERHGLLHQDALAHLAFMAFDGFVANQRIHGRSRRMEVVIELMAGLLLEGRFDPPARLAVSAAASRRRPA
jgi:AcrR family transcriptional regulator